MMVAANPPETSYGGALALITIATSFLLVPEATVASPLQWIRVPLPVLFGATTGYHAYRTHRPSL